MIVSETNGVWGHARRLRLPTGLAGHETRSISLGSLVCTSRGNCEAVAGYSSGPGAALVATERHGIWRRVSEIIPPAGAVAQGLGSIACTAPGDCVAVGAAGNRPMLAVQTHGVWARARAVGPPAGVRFTSKDGVGHLYAVTCPSAGNCVAVGNYAAAYGHGAMAVSEVHGVWRHPQRVLLPANATRTHHVSFALPPLLLSVACTKPGTCVAVGTYGDAYINDGANGEPMIAREKNGRWRRAEQIDLPRHVDPPAFIQTSWLTSVSCPDLTHCVAVGFYNGTRHGDAMLLTQDPN